jgi:hypothetical protein
MRKRIVNQTIEERFQSIENQLSEIRKELEGSLARYYTPYKNKHYPFNADLDPRTATGYGLRYLAQEAGVDFDALDTDEQVRNKLENE